MRCLKVPTGHMIAWKLHFFSCEEYTSTIEISAHFSQHMCRAVDLDILVSTPESLGFYFITTLPQLKPREAGTHENKTVEWANEITIGDSEWKVKRILIWWCKPRILFRIYHNRGWRAPTRRERRCFCSRASKGRGFAEARPHDAPV